MDPYKYIPDNDRWKISKNRVFKKKLAWIPIFDMKEDHIEIFFDLKMSKDILLLIPKLDIDFYLISPIFADPQNKHLEKDKINIKNYLTNYSQEGFYDGFNKIGFDVISNLIRYCRKNDSMMLIRECYDEVNKIVQKESYDPWSNTYTNKRDDIRDEFNSLYRQIKLAQILG